MTGPEHYSRAAWLLEQLAGRGSNKAAQASTGLMSADAIVAVAQVHATLALAAATALTEYDEDGRESFAAEHHAWQKAAGVQW